MNGSFWLKKEKQTWSSFSVTQGWRIITHEMKKPLEAVKQTCSGLFNPGGKWPFTLRVNQTRPSAPARPFGCFSSLRQEQEEQIKTKNRRKFYTRHARRECKDLSPDRRRNKKQAWVFWDVWTQPETPVCSPQAAAVHAESGNTLL